MPASKTKCTNSALASSKPNWSWRIAVKTGEEMVDDLRPHVEKICSDGPLGFEELYQAP